MTRTCGTTSGTWVSSTAVDEKLRREKFTALGTCFRPSGPIDTGDLFSGRTSQIIQIGTTITTPGRHGVIYGERGVGKTSIASVAAEFFPVTLSIRVNCDASDTFANLWQRVLEEIQLRSRLQSWQYGDVGRAIVGVAAQAFDGDEIGPDRVRHFFRALDELGNVLVFLDEYDQIADYAVHSLMAATIKTLSDDLVRSTVVLVGVADNVDALIEEHESIERNMEEIPMPRMNYDEIRSIVNTGYEGVGISIEDATLDRLTRLPQGLPHFAHLLAQEAGKAAVLEGREVVNDQDLRKAIARCVQSSEASLTQVYHDATDSAHGDALFGSVLLACALAPVDDLGYFAPSDILDPLQRVMDRRYEHSSFARHLVSFCNERGPVLERKGGERHWRYRFLNPRMRPFVLMRAMHEGVRDDLLEIAPQYPTAPQLPFGQ